VLPDVAPLLREFDYSVPSALDTQVRVGTMVRISLQGRRVGGWVVDADVTPPPGVSLRPLSHVTGWGPGPDIVALAAWAAWRWAGTRAALLRTASPEFAVRTLPAPSVAARDQLRSLLATDGQILGLDGLVPDDPDTPAAGRAIVRLAPAADALGPILAVAARGPCLVVTPMVTQASALAGRLRTLGIPVAEVPREWPQAAAGVSVVIGARGAAWAPCPDLAGVVVVDGHDEGLQQEQAPTWSAWVVALERARRAGVPCVVVSSCPTVELLEWSRARVVLPDRARERAGWAPLEVVDLSRQDRRLGLYSPRLVNLVRSGGRVVCMLNRKGRVRLLACGTCNELVRCERCGAAVSLGDEALTCARCGATRPKVCLACGSTRMKALRVGVSRVREELEHLAGRPVGEVTAETDTIGDEAVVVGTEAVLRRLPAADALANVQIDQELQAPRYRAAEEAMALLALASRLVGGRSRSGRVLVQTRIADHEVLTSALRADPGRLAAHEAPLRRLLALPPATAVALVSGPGAAEYVKALGGVDVLGPNHERWLVKAPDHATLADALAATPRPRDRLRVEVDPRRL
jgi:primosomal protein N' (replication factor Y)